MIVHPRNDATGRVPDHVRCLCHDELGNRRQPCPYDVCMVEDEYVIRPKAVGS